MITKCNLPDSITLPCGAVLKPVVGGHLENEPFLTKVDITKNGWLGYVPPFREDEMIIEEAKRRKLKYRKVGVLSRNLRGRNDLYGLPYSGTNWVFVQVNKK